MCDATCVADAEDHHPHHDEGVLCSHTAPEEDQQPLPQMPPVEDSGEVRTLSLRASEQNLGWGTGNRFAGCKACVRQMRKSVRQKPKAK